MAWIAEVLSNMSTKRCRLNITDKQCNGTSGHHQYQAKRLRCISAGGILADGRPPLRLLDCNGAPVLGLTQCRRACGIRYQMFEPSYQLYFGPLIAVVRAAIDWMA